MIGKRFDSVNLMKIICAVIIASATTNSFMQFGNSAQFIVNSISAIAFPFLFITSGFLLQEKYQRNEDVKKYLKKIIFVYLISTMAACFVPQFISIIKSTSHEGGLVAVVILILKDLFISGINKSLCFFPALIYGILIVKFFLNKHKLKKCLIIGCVLYCAALVCDSINFDGVSSILSSILFVTIGIYINKYDLKNKLKKVEIIFLLSVVLYGLEIFLFAFLDIKRYGSVYIALIPLVFMIFILCIRSKLCINERISSLMDNSSLWFIGLSETVYLAVLGYINVEIKATVYFWILVSVITVFISYLISLISVRSMPVNKKVLTKFVVYCVTITALISVFFAAIDASSFVSGTNLNGLFDAAVKTGNGRSKGELYKVSKENNYIYIFGGMDYGDQETYPLDKKVENAIDDSDVLAVQQYIKVKDKVGVEEAKKYTDKDSLNLHFDEDELQKIYGEKINKFGYGNGIYNYFKYKIPYVYNLVKKGYRKDGGRLKDDYSTANYIKYRADKENKEFEGIASPTVGLEEEYFTNTQEEENAYFKIGQFMNTNNEVLASSNLSLWKEGRSKEIKNYLEVPKPDNELTGDYENYIALIKENDKKTDDLKIAADVESIDKVFANNNFKKYFVNVNYRLLIENNNLLDKLRSSGYTVEKIG